jgi:uncharacterized protein (TIGR02118 family)
MFTLIVQVKRPKNQALFEDHLWNIRLPLVNELPGIKGIRVHKVDKSLRGENSLWGMIELYFDDKETLETAMGSEEAKKAIVDGSRLENEAGTAMTFDYYCTSSDA